MTNTNIINKFIKKKLLSHVPNTRFSHMKDKYYCLKGEEGKLYSCPACKKKHRTCILYAFTEKDYVVVKCLNKRFNGKKPVRLFKYKDSLSDSNIDNNEYENNNDDENDIISTVKIKREYGNPRQVKISDNIFNAPKVLNIRVNKEITVDSNLFKKNKKDLPANENPKVDDPFDIYYKLKPEENVSIENDEGEFVSKYGLELYNKMHKAFHYNRDYQIDDPDYDLKYKIAEERSMIRTTVRGAHKFGSADPRQILDAINMEEPNKEIHECPRYNCSIYFDLDDKDMEGYKNIHNMYKDFIILMTIVFERIIAIKGSNKEFIKPFDPSKLVIHADDHGLNSMHIIYDNDGKVFYNTAYLQQFMYYVKNIVEEYIIMKKTFSEETNDIMDAIKRISTVIDWNVYSINHSLRTIGSIKQDEYANREERKFIKYKFNMKIKKLVKCKSQKITAKDIISKARNNEYCMKIPHGTIKKNKKFYQPTDQSLANGLADKFQSQAPDTLLVSEINGLFGFNAIRGSPYRCPACETEHKSNGWYGFMKGNKGYAGCHGMEYKKNNIGGRYLFSLNVAECNKNNIKFKSNTIKSSVREIIKRIDSGDYKKSKRKWSFCDYIKFVRDEEPTKLEDIVEYFHETVAHVIDCGENRLFTKSYLNDGSIGIKPIKKIFYKDDDVHIETIINSERTEISLHNVYYNCFYNYCSYDYIDFIPYLDKEDDKSRALLNNNTFNLFQGFMYEYRKIDCEQVIKDGKLMPIFEHIDLLANNDKAVAEYIIMWIAFTIQFPAIKNKVALAFYSKKEQAGKNIFWNYIAEKIFGKTLSRSVNSMEALTQRFNKGSEGKLLTIGNEIASYAKHKDFDKIKSLITDIMQEIEPKGFDSYQIHDYNAYIFLTNNFNFMQINSVVSRVFISEIDESKIGDFKYFDRLTECMNDNAELFFNYLANMDLTDYEIRNIPMTNMKKQLIEDNILPPLKFIRHMVDMGEEDMYDYLGMDNDQDLPNSVSNCIIKNHKSITKAELFMRYKIWHAEENEYSHKGKTEFFRELSENKITSSNNRLSGQSGRPWHIGIKYEDLETASKDFTR